MQERHPLVLGQVPVRGGEVEPAAGLCVGIAVAVQPLEQEQGKGRALQGSPACARARAWRTSPARQPNGQREGGKEGRQDIKEQPA